MIEFKAWPKTPRLFRDMVITEKIDGTNAAVVVDDEPLLGNWEPGQRLGQGVVVHLNGESRLVGAQSRKRLITPEADNYGFARWVFENAQALADTLDTGRHFGEWWGSGIQRGYGLTNGDKRFSLFNVERYAHVPACQEDGLPNLGVVPTLYRGPFDLDVVEIALADLGRYGSGAAPGFDRPEGVIVFHAASSQVYKVLLEGDNLPKSLAGAA